MNKFIVFLKSCFSYTPNVKYNFDVFGYYVKDNYLSIETLFIREGIIIGRVHKIFDITDEINDVYLRYITNFYDAKQYILHYSKYFGNA